MVISQIVAVSINGVIGSDGKLPWHIQEDLLRFKAITMNKTLIMGRYTFESLPKKLEGRRIIVLSSKIDSIPGAEVARSIEDALYMVKDESEIFIAGGEIVYRLTVPYTNRIYLTEVDMIVEGDAFYPLSILDGFKLIKTEESELPNIKSYKVYER